MDFISFKLADIFATFASLETFKEYCLEKSKCVDDDGVIYFEDDSYVRFHDDTFSLGSPMEMEWFD